MLDFTNSPYREPQQSYKHMQKTSRKPSFYIFFLGFRFSVNSFLLGCNRESSRARMNELSTIAGSGTVRDVKVRVRERTHAFAAITANAQLAINPALAGNNVQLDRSHGDTCIVLPRHETDVFVLWGSRHCAVQCNRNGIIRGGPQ